MLQWVCLKIILHFCENTVCYGWNPFEIYIQREEEQRMPGVKIVTQPYLLMEAVELLYLFMNNDSFHNTRRNFFLKYSEQLSEVEREYYETLFRTLE